MRKQIKGILAAALSAAMVVSFGSAAGVNKASAEDTTTDTTTEAKHTYNAILGFESAGDPDWAYRKFVENEDQGIKSKDYDCVRAESPEDWGSCPFWQTYSISMV